MVNGALCGFPQAQVALRTEGVDRNIDILHDAARAVSRPPHGGRG